MKKEGENIVFTGEEMIVYIPEDHFEKGIAVDYGTSVSVIGLLNAQLFENGKKKGKLSTMNVPTVIHMQPSEMLKPTEELIVDDENVESDRYVKARFIAGDIVMPVNIPQDSGNVELFVKLITGGKIPVTISYDDVFEIWLKNLEINNVNLNIPAVTMSVLLREIYRNALKPEQPFSIVYGEGKVSPYGYRTANIRQVCAFNSVFSAITFEDTDSSNISSINTTVSKKQQSVSPIEEIIKM